MKKNIKRFKIQIIVLASGFTIFLIFLGFFTSGVVSENLFKEEYFYPAVVIGLTLLISLAILMISQLLFYKQKFLMKKKYGELSFKEKLSFISVILMVSLICFCLATTIGQWTLISIYKSGDDSENKQPNPFDNL